MDISGTHGDRRRGRTACHDNQPHNGNGLVHRLPVHIFCEDVRWVVGAEDLAELDGLGPDFVLNPKVCRGQVPDLTDPLSACRC